MSGGSYNYLYLKLEDEDWQNAQEDLHDMEVRLRAAGYIMPADKIAKFIGTYEMMNKMLNIRAQDITELTKIVEWIDSSDWGIDVLENWIAEQGVAVC